MEGVSFLILKLLVMGLLCGYQEKQVYRIHYVVAPDNICCLKRRTMTVRGGLLYGNLGLLLELLAPVLSEH